MKLTDAKKRAIRKIFNLSDEELQEWVDDEGEDEVLKVFKALGEEVEEPEEEISPKDVREEVIRILKSLNSEKAEEKPDEVEFGEEVGDPAKLRDGLTGLRQLARNVTEEVLRNQMIAAIDALLKQLGVIKKSLRGYNPRDGTISTPEFESLKRKMHSNW